MSDGPGFDVQMLASKLEMHISHAVALKQLNIKTACYNQILHELLAHRGKIPQ